MIRDEWGFILQEPEMDGDDSPVRNGLMALSGSLLDQTLMPFFVLGDGSCIRHPFQSKRGNNMPEANSRDQLILTVAGLWAGDEIFYLRSIRSHYGLFINKDFLSPSHQLFMSTAAKHWSRFIWALPGALFMALDIFWHMTLGKKHELNQMIAICSVMGSFWLKLLTKCCPWWERNIEDYFGAYPESHGFWRNQPEIAQNLIKYVKTRIGG